MLSWRPGLWTRPDLMRSVIQRVSRASVSVGGAVVGRIGAGLMVLVGVADGGWPGRCRLHGVEDSRCAHLSGRRRQDEPVGHGHWRIGSARVTVHVARRRAEWAASGLHGRGGSPGRAGDIRKFGRRPSKCGARRRDRRLPGPHGCRARQRRSGDDPDRQPAAVLSSPSKKREGDTVKKLIVGVLALASLCVGAGTAGAQSRPLVTEDPETVPVGTSCLKPGSTSPATPSSPHRA